MSDIDQLSRVLGSIETAISNLVDGHKDTIERLAVINDKVSSQGTAQVLDKAQIEAAHKRLDKMEPLVNGHEEKFRFGAWLITGISILIGFIVQYLLPFLGHLFR